MGSINDLARKDFKRIVEGSEWGVEIIFNPLTDPVVIKGITTDHTSLYDPDDGTKSLDRSLHINVVEETLNAAGITTRDARGNVAINDLKVQVLEPTGTIDAVIRESHPDKKIGCIRMILDLANYE